MNILQFRRPANADDTAVAIFATLAISRGTDIEITCRQFLDRNPQLTAADLAAGFGLGRKVLDVFQRYLARAAADESGGAA
jgi:hypothetical protein